MPTGPDTPYVPQQGQDYQDCGSTKRPAIVPHYTSPVNPAPLNTPEMNSAIWWLSELFSASNKLQDVIEVLETKLSVVLVKPEFMTPVRPAREEKPASIRQAPLSPLASSLSQAVDEIEAGIASIQKLADRLDV